MCAFLLFERGFGDKTYPPTIAPLEVEPAEMEGAENEKQEDEGEESNSLLVDPLQPDAEYLSTKEAVQSAEVRDKEDPSENGAAETTEEENPNSPQEVEDSRSPQGIRKVMF